MQSGAACSARPGCSSTANPSGAGTGWRCSTTGSAEAAGDAPGSVFGKARLELQVAARALEQRVFVGAAARETGAVERFEQVHRLAVGAARPDLRGGEWQRVETVPRADARAHRAREEGVEVAGAARFARGVEGDPRRGRRRAERARQLRALPAAQIPETRAEQQRGAEQERPEVERLPTRDGRALLERRARLRVGAALEHVEGERLAARGLEPAGRRVEVGELERRQVNPAGAGGHERVAERAARAGAAAVLADRDARGFGEDLDVVAEQLLERRRLGVPDVRISREIDRDGERLAQAHAVVRGGDVQLELPDQSVGRDAVGERAHAQARSAHGELALRSALPDVAELRGRDLELAGAGREERAAELRAVQAARVVGQRARAESLRPEAVERRRLPGRARVAWMQDLERHDDLLVQIHQLAIEV